MTVTVDEQTIDMEAVVAFAQKVFADQAVANGTALAYVGERLGLWAALAGAGRVTSAELAERTGFAERYLREWLSAQAAAGYLDYDATDRTFTLPAERAAVLADAGSPADMTGGFVLAAALWAGTGRLAESFRTGRGIAWGDQDPRLFSAVDRGFGALYRGSLVQEWLPALDGVVERLTAGARVLDVGCGLGNAALLIADAFPNTSVVGIDPHQGSIREAERAASAQGVSDRVRFDVGTAVDYPLRDWDLICFFDALHDMGDPLGAARYARSAVAADGTVLFVEPGAGDRLEDNLHPVGLQYYAASTAFCVPGSLSQHVGAALGAQAGGERLCAVLTEAGFSRVRVAVRTDFNLVIEARP